MFDVTLAFVNGVLSVECGDVQNLFNPENIQPIPPKFEAGEIGQNASPYFGVKNEANFVNPDHIPTIPPKFETNFVNPDNLQPIPPKFEANLINPDHIPTSPPLK